MAIVAICDDSKDGRDLAIKQIEKYNQSQGEANKLTVREFASSKKLWFESKDTNIADIYVLDIDMPEMNGIDLAKSIRQNNPKGIIIFLTSHAEYASAGYKVSAFRYVYKLNIEEELPEALHEALKYLNTEEQAYVGVKSGTEFIRLPFSEIRYVQRVQRQLEIHTVHHGVVKNNQGIKELLSKLDSSRFVLIDRSCFVNIDYVTRITDGDIWIFGTEERLAISRRNLSAVKAAIAKGWKL